jgi:hypothetical protein
MIALSNAEDNQNQFPPNYKTGPDQVIPIDLARYVDYQVVLKYDIDNAIAYAWVNPASESDTANWSGPTGDLGSITNGLAGLMFRQKGGGTMDIRDVVVGDTFADVMTNAAAASPVLVATNYQTVTNYAGNPALLEVFATSFGGGVPSYQWYQITSDGATNLVSGNSQKHLVNSLAGSDTGNYFCAVTNSGGQGALSGTNFYISVNTTPTPPTFTSKPPAATNIAIGSALVLSSAIYGSGPLSCVWTFNGNPLTDGSPATANPGDASVVSGSHTPVLTVSGMSTNEIGSFLLTVTSGASGLPFNTTNTTVVTAVHQVGAVSIAYIRSLEDTSTWQITDTTSIFTISNAVVTMFTNVTGGTTASYYIQDATGGLDMFVTGDASFRPNMGDIIAISGTLSSYNNSIELLINSGNPYSFYGVTGHTNVLPAPIVFDMALTNNAGLMETNLEGKIVMITNVYFTVASIPFTNSLTSYQNTYVTNNNPGSVPLNVYFPGGTDVDVRGQVITNRFAYTITGVLAQYKSGAYSAAGYELYVTRFGDVVFTPPPPFSVTASTSGNNVVLSWTAVPYTIDTRGAYSYTVLAATDVTGPYHPLASLAFNTTSGTYTVTNALQGPRQFYRISSP